jgi:adenylate cyclase
VTVTRPAHQPAGPVEHETHPAAHTSTQHDGDEWDQVRWASGVEPPWDDELGAGPRTVVRTFCFIDLCGSTSYFEQAGPVDTTMMVTEFRNLVRAIASRRGVRVAKWLGDGAMLVGVSTGPVIASAVEILHRWSPDTLKARAGVSVSHALLLDGDDYLARGANFAARICDAADADEVLCDADCLAAVPTWVQRTGTRHVDVRGMGRYEVTALRVDPDALAAG